MTQIIQWVMRIGDKTGSLGAVDSAMGCAMCFTAIASLGAAVGLGFLAQWGGLFVNTLLPLFAWIMLALNALGWFSHRQWHRSLLGMVGPTLLLLSLHPWFQYGWSTYVTYCSSVVAVELAQAFARLGLDEHFRSTSNPAVYAAGDAGGGPLPLTFSTRYSQVKFANVGIPVDADAVQVC